MYAGYPLFYGMAKRVFVLLHRAAASALDKETTTQMIRKWISPCRSISNLLAGSRGIGSMYDTNRCF